MRVNIDDDTHHDQRPEEIIETRWTASSVPTGSGAASGWRLVRAGAVSQYTSASFLPYG